MDRFDQNLPLALAAYNAGKGAVHSYRGIPPYAETQIYVRKILGDFGSGDGLVARPVVFRVEQPDGSVKFTNIAPASRRR